VLDKLLLAL